jgi:hypothetical protein
LWITVRQNGEEGLMNASDMLHQMCHEVLSNVDVKAITKARGFSGQEVASRALFETYFVSDIGVEAVMATLSRKEVALLHLLRFLGEAVDVTVFERVYGDEHTRRAYYGTFTQRYSGIYKQVRDSLIRKGLLLVAEDRLSGASTKMERWRFRFPQEFEPFLPPLFESTRTLKGIGDVRHDVLRDKVLEIVGGRRPSPLGKSHKYDLGIVEGELRTGGEPFEARRLLEWQQACWEAAVPSPSAKTENAVPPVQAVNFAFSQLGAKEWIPPEQLNLPLRVFCAAALGGREICAAGWKWGYLARQTVDGTVYYRPSGEEDQAAQELDIGASLDASTRWPVLVNLAEIPYGRLELLARISDLEIVGDRLAATPNLVRMGRALEAVRGRPLTRWLRDHAPAFRQALGTVEGRWGRQIVHENLLIAQVDDLALKVQLERAFADSRDVVFLAGDFVAFPYDLLPEVERAVTRWGHVIRTVQADG